MQQVKTSAPSQAPLGNTNTWLPMGLKCSPVVSQSVMENILASIPDIDALIDDIGAFSTS